MSFDSISRGKVGSSQESHNTMICVRTELNYICGIETKNMNLQTILEPIEDLFMWLFSLLEASGDAMNCFLIAVFFIATVYWIWKLIGYRSEEVPNR